jgi:hypothetical protein
MFCYLHVPMAAHLQHVSVRDAFAPRASNEAGGQVDQIRELRAGVALRLERDLAQVYVIRTRPPVQVHLPCPTHKRVRHPSFWLKGLRDVLQTGMNTPVFGAAADNSTLN